MSNRKIQADYVCPCCFRRIENCICNIAPETLIQIDFAIQDHIRILNEKGYITETCCESHFVNDGNLNGLTQIYIAFVCGLPEDAEIPKDFKITKGRQIISYKYPNRNLTIGEFEKIKNKELKTLLEFVCSLPPMR